MGLKFDALDTVNLQRESYRFRVRVVRKWYLPGFMNPEQPMSMELILMDDAGNRIQATVRKAVLYKFSELIKEGVVYRMSHFGVVQNTGSYRATPHEYKLVFQLRTTVSEYTCDSIPFFGIVPLSFDTINAMESDYDYLIDVAGMLSSVSAQREYLRDAKVMKMVVIELTDPIECTLFGDYVDQISSFLHDFQSIPPMVVLQYAKVKLFRGKPVVQNTLYASRFLINPDVQEVIDIKDRILASGFSVSENCAFHLEYPKKSIEDEFLKINPKKNIQQLLLCDEDGLSILASTITDIVSDGHWWYSSCKCHRSVVPDNGLYYCSICNRHVFNVIPRYKLRIDVCDPSGSTNLILFDYDVEYLVHKSCSDLLESFHEGLDGDEYPPIFKGLVGRKLLFNVANPVSGSSADTGSIKVRGVCDEPHIISAFESANSGIPAEEVIPLSVVPPVVDLSSDHSEDIGDANILTSAALGEPNYTCSFNSPPSTPPVSAVLQTPPTTLKKKFDNLFADDTPPIHVARKRVNKAVKK